MAQKDTEFGMIDASKICWFSWWYHSNWSSIKFGLKKRLVTRFCYKPPRTQLVCQSVKRSFLFPPFFWGRGSLRFFLKNSPSICICWRGGGKNSDISKGKGVSWEDVHHYSPHTNLDAKQQGKDLGCMYWGGLCRCLTILVISPMS